MAVERDATVTIRLLAGEPAGGLLDGLLARGVVDEVLTAGAHAPAASGDVVAFVDAEAPGFGEHVVCGLIGPVVCEPGAQLALGASGAGRLSELTAKPLLRRHRPALAAVRHPLAPEVAARRALLERAAAPTRDAARLALLLAAHAAVGLRGLAQVDLGLPVRDEASLAALATVAEELLETIGADG